jgi:16S rRNA processing protein RimM
VRPFSIEQSHFKKFKEVFVQFGDGRKVYSVEAVRMTRPLVVLKLTGIDTCEDAALLVGREIRVERSFAQALRKGEYYADDLLRCMLCFRGETVGRVVSLCDSPAHDLLEIERADGKKILVPFVDHFIGEIDLGNKKIHLKEDYILS